MPLIVRIVLLVFSTTAAQHLVWAEAMMIRPPAFPCNGVTQTPRFYFTVEELAGNEGYPHYIVGPVKNSITRTTPTLSAVTKSRAASLLALTAEAMKKDCLKQFNCERCLPDKDGDGLKEPGVKFIDDNTWELAGAMLTEAEFDPLEDCQVHSFQKSTVHGKIYQEVKEWRCLVGPAVLDLGLVTEEAVSKPIFHALDDVKNFRQTLPSAQGGCLAP